MPNKLPTKRLPEQIETLGSTLNPPDNTNAPTRYDANGHIIGGSRFGATLTLAPFPERNYMSLLEKGSSIPFELTISGDLTTLTMKAKNAVMNLAITVTPRVYDKPAYYVSTVEIAPNGQAGPPTISALEGQGDLNPYLERAFEQFVEYRFIKENFTDLLAGAGKDLETYLTPEALGQIDSATGVPNVLWTLGWGTVGRAFVWGLAGALAAWAAPAEAGAIVIAFAVGMSASAITEAWNALEDAQGGPDRDKKAIEQPDMSASDK
jgi:hypothetical protein